jgi:hypothetical protein
MKEKLFGLFAALMAFGAVPCHAITTYVTYTGNVSGVDSEGLFGTPGANLSGSSYTAYFVFDVILGQPGTLIQSPTENFISAGGSSSPALGATLTIGGFSQSIGAPNFAQVDGANYGGSNGYTAQYYSVDSSSANLYNNIYNYLGSSSGLPASITTAFSYAVLPGDSVSGQFVVYSGVGFPPIIFEFLHLTPTSLSVSLSPTTTPLPAALPLFVTGVGALGLLGWRGKRKAAALAA